MDLKLRIIWEKGDPDWFLFKLIKQFRGIRRDIIGFSLTIANDPFTDFGGEIINLRCFGFLFRSFMGK